MAPPPRRRTRAADRRDGAGRSSRRRRTPARPHSRGRSAHRRAAPPGRPARTPAGAPAPPRAGALAGAAAPTPDPPPPLPLLALGGPPEGQAAPRGARRGQGRAPQPPALGPVGRVEAHLGGQPALDRRVARALEVGGEDRPPAELLDALEQVVHLEVR